VAGPPKNIRRLHQAPAAASGLVSGGTRGDPDRDKSSHFTDRYKVGVVNRL